MRKLTMTENMTPIDKKLIEKGMTRSDLSKQSGVPLRTIESWCRRLRVPRDVYQLLKLAKVLGCQIEDLIEPEAGDKKQEEQENPRQRCRGAFFVIQISNPAFLTVSAMAL